MKFKKITTCFLCLFLIMGITSCGEQTNIESNSKQEEPIVEQKYTITFIDLDGNKTVKEYKYNEYARIPEDEDGWYYSQDDCSIDNKAESTIIMKEDIVLYRSKVEDTGPDFFKGLEFLKEPDEPEYNENEIQAMIDENISLEEYAKKINTIADVAHLYKLLNLRYDYITPNWNIIDYSNNGFVAYSLGSPVQYTIKDRIGVCNSFATLANFLLKGDYEKMGYVQTNSHVFNYYYEDGYYYFVDFTRFIVNYFDPSRIKNDNIVFYYYKTTNPEEFGELHGKSNLTNYTYMVMCESDTSWIAIRDYSKNGLSYNEYNNKQLVYTNNVEAKLIYSNPPNDWKCVFINDKLLENIDVDYYFVNYMEKGLYTKAEQKIENNNTVIVHTINIR